MHTCPVPAPVEMAPARGKLGVLHVILDNLATHKTQAVRSCLLEHPKVRRHFTPTYSSWLNQVELWFSKIERDQLARIVEPSQSRASDE